MIPFRMKLPETHRIKIGGYGKVYEDRNGKKRRLPEKWGHFKITSTEREKDDKLPEQYCNLIPDEAMTRLLACEGEKDPGKPRRIGPCYLPFDTIEANLYTVFAYYTASELVCRGNGIKALSMADGEIDCVPNLCPFYEAKKCRPSGVLSVIFPQSKNLGGVAVFRTKSRNSIESMLSQMVLYISQRGSLAGVPFNLVLQSKRTADADGKMHNIDFVTLEYEGTFEQFLALPQRTAPKLIDVSAEVIRGQYALIRNGKKLLESPEEFGDISDGDIEDAKSEPVEPEVPAEPAKTKKGKKKKEKPVDKPETPKAEKAKEEAPQDHAPAVEDNGEAAKEADPEPERFSVIKYLAREGWAIDLADAKVLLEAVDGQIKAKGREYTNTRLAKYGVTVSTFETITPDAALEMLTAIQAALKAREDAKSATQKIKEKADTEHEAAYNEACEYLDEHQKLINPDAGETEAAHLNTMAVKDVLELEVDGLADVKDFKTDQLKKLSKGLVKLIDAENKRVAKEAQRVKEAQEADELRKEKEAAFGGDEEDDPGVF